MKLLFTTNLSDHFKLLFLQELLCIATILVTTTPLFLGVKASGISTRGEAETTTIPNASYSNVPSEASVELINALNETVVVHCWSHDSDLGSKALLSGKNFYWSFHPNIFGKTVFHCTFLWKALKQEFVVWEGSAHSDRLPCCSKGPCSYKITREGFYNALTVDTDDNGPAESWEYFEPWLPNPIGGKHIN